jgi:transposase
MLLALVGPQSWRSFCYRTVRNPGTGSLLGDRNCRPECLDDFIGQDNPARVVDAFGAQLDLAALGFDGAAPPLTGRLAPDFKTIADFRRDNGRGIRNVCRRFVALCRELKLFSHALVAIDGSKFKAVNNRNFTHGKLDKRREQIERSPQRYLDALATADHTQPAEFEAKIERLRQHMRRLDEFGEQLKIQPDGQLSLSDPHARSMATNCKGSGMVGYNVQGRSGCQTPPDRGARGHQRRP